MGYLINGAAEVLARYLPGLQLRDYDSGALPSAEPSWFLSVGEAREIIAAVSAEFPADGLFGIERDDTLEGVLHTLYSGFGGHAQYPARSPALAAAQIPSISSTVYGPAATTAGSNTCGLRRIILAVRPAMTSSMVNSPASSATAAWK